ncbi:hypothetical protein GS416_11795 [Rhodococcus hoagii]|nr:hypothetical protein [Prescottella equi]
MAPAARTTMRVMRELPLVKSHRPRRSVNCVAPLTYTNRIPVPAVFCRWSIDTFVPVTFALSSWNTAAFEICVGAAVTMIPSTSRVPLLTTNVCAAAPSMVTLRIIDLRVSSAPLMGLRSTRIAWFPLVIRVACTPSTMLPHESEFEPVWEKMFSRC